MTNDPPIKIKKKPLINVRRSEEDKLDLPTPAPNPMSEAKIDRTDIRDAKKPNRDLKRLGSRLLPAGCKYVGSLAVHIYLPSLPQIEGLKHTCISQVVGVGEVPPLLYDLALKELAINTMRKFGYSIPKTRGQTVTESTEEGIDS
jgi:hypothetical protein